MYGSGVVGLQAQVGEGHPRPHGVGVKRRGVEGPRPVGFGRGQAFESFSTAIVQDGVVEGARAAGGVVGVHGLHERRLVQTDLARQCRQAVGLEAGEHRWHEAADRFGVDDGMRDLPWLLRHQAAPDGIALGPEVFALVVKTLRFTVHHHAERDAVQPGADAAVVQRRTGVDGHHVGLCRVTDRIGPQRQQLLEENALVEAGATDEEVIGGPLATRVLAPCLTQPFAVGLETSSGHHAGFGGDAFVTHVRGDKTVTVHFDAVHRCVVANLHAQAGGAAVIGVQQRLAATHEKGIGARQVQRARQRGLKAHAVAAHPVAAGAGGTDCQARQGLAGKATGDLKQVLPKFFFGVGLGQHVLRRIVHATQVARVHGVATAPFTRCGFKQQHARPGLARCQRRTQGGVAAANHQNIDFHRTASIRVVSGEL